MRSPIIACFATQGTGSFDEARIASLLESLEPEVLPFNRSDKRRSAAALWRRLDLLRPDLVVMEGTGVAGGSAVMALRVARNIRYIVSSGDAIAPFWGLRNTALRFPGGLYERSLMTLSAGFIGWSPYLVGRALTLGATRAMTAANWAPPTVAWDRVEIREKLGVPRDAIVFGLVGSLTWNSRVGYVYGLELVRAVSRTRRADIRVMIVGGGNGLEHLRRAAGADERVIMPGAVPRQEVGSYLAAMDVASLPQSADGVGSFRYTTKLSEYLAAGVPIATGQIPLAYDLDEGWIWRLRGAAPWEDVYVSSLASLMEEIDHEEIAQRRHRIPIDGTLFDRERQERLVTAFISDVLADTR